MLGCLDDGTNELSTKRLIIQVLFFFLQNSLQNSFKKPFHEITKIRIKSFGCPKSWRSVPIETSMPKPIKSIKENKTWNIRPLVDDSFVSSSKQPSVIYCRLTDFTMAEAAWWLHKIMITSLFTCVEVCDCSLHSSFLPKIRLGTSDPWSTIHLSHLPSNPA